MDKEKAWLIGSRSRHLYCCFISSSLPLSVLYFVIWGSYWKKKKVLQQKETSENYSSMPIPFFYSYGGLFIHLTNTFEHLLCSRPWRRCRVPFSSSLYRGVSQIVPVTPQNQNKIWNPYPWFLVLPEMTIRLLTENILKTSRKSWHGIDYLGSVYTSLREWLLSWRKNTNLFEVLLSPKYWCCMDFLPSYF